MIGSKQQLEEFLNEILERHIDLTLPALIAINEAVDNQTPLAFDSNIEATFFEEKLAKRTHNLFHMLDSIPGEHAVTKPMIERLGCTIANRIFEVCNDLDKDVYKDGRKVKRQDLIRISKQVLNQICYVFVKMYVNNRDDLTRNLVQAVVDMCQSRGIVFIVDKKNTYMFTKVNELGRKSHEKLIIPMDEDFPEL